METEHSDRPLSEEKRPFVIVGYTLYALAIASVGLLLLGLAIWRPDYISRQFSENGNGTILVAIVGTVILVIHALGVVGLSHRWGWKYGAVVVALGAGSCLFIVTIPMLLAWLEPKVRSHFAVE